MITTHIRYGGNLTIGDFIGVGNGYHMAFGWYSGNGKSGTVQYVTSHVIAWEFNAYNSRMNSTNTAVMNSNPKDRKGFTLDHIGKSYVMANKANTIVKITCPDDCFSGKDLQDYLEAKRILTDMKFLKR